MTKEEFDFMEVRPKEEGLYVVTLYDYDGKNYSIVDLFFTGECWEYKGFKNSYVCFIHKKKQQ